MPLDFPSIIMAVILMNLLFSVIMIAYSHSLRPRMNEMKCLAIGYLLLVAGSLLLLLRDLLPGFLGLVLGYFFILEAYIVLRMGIFFFQGRRIRWRLINSAMVLIPLWFAIFTFALPLYAARSFFFNGAIIVVCAWTVHSLSLDRDPSLSAVRRLAVTFLVASALLALAKLVSTFVSDERMRAVGESEWDAAALALQGCLLSAIGFTLVLMRAERLSALSRQKQAAVEESLLEKETLLREIHHRVKNNLQIIISLINLRLEASDDEAARRTLQDIERKVRAMSLVHERLFESPSLSKVGMQPYLESLVSSYHDSFDLDEASIAYHVEAGGLELPLELAMPIGLIVGELITNSKLHAFAGRSQGLVRVSLSQVGSFLRLEVTDNGIGLQSGHEEGSGRKLGHLLVRSLADQLRGELSVQSREGLSVTVDRIPFGA